MTDEQIAKIKAIVKELDERYRGLGAPGIRETKAVIAAMCDLLAEVEHLQAELAQRPKITVRSYVRPEFPIDPDED